jgi:hypothetical protein
VVVQVLVGGRVGLTSGMELEGDWFAKVVRRVWWDVFDDLPDGPKNHQKYIQSFVTVHENVVVGNRSSDIKASTSKRISRTLSCVWLGSQDDVWNRRE